MITCLRCGNCCHYWKDGKLKKCKFLIKLSNGKTLCRDYNARLGRVLDVIDGKEVKCIMREDSKYNYEGCSFNVLHPKNPIFPKNPKELTQDLNSNSNL